jgi:hypothetical protein
LRPRLAPFHHTLATCGLMLASGCFPAITHGPKVENGLIFGVTGGGVSGPVHTEGDVGGIRLRQPVIGPFIGYGVAPSRPERAGFYFGAAVPLLFPLAQIDAFLQLPPAWTGPLSAGVGTIASIDHVDGYAMLGGPIDHSTAWHVGVGYGSRHAARDIPSRALVGSVAIARAAGFVRTQAFVQHAAGRIPGSCSYDNFAARICRPGARATATAVGLSVGRHRRNANRNR